MAYRLYCRNLTAEAAVMEMRRVYPGFSIKTWMRWVTEEQWPQRRAAADDHRRRMDDDLQALPHMMIEALEQTRLKLAKDIEAQEKPDPQAVYALTTVTKQLSALVQIEQKARDPRRLQSEILQRFVESLIAELKGVEGLKSVLEREAEAVAEAFDKVASAYA
jgi:tRNA U55 pseudouridine synthase TruB